MNFTGQEILAKHDDTYNLNYYAWNPLYPLAERDLLFYLGDQWTRDEKKDLMQQGRSTFVYNLIRPKVNMVTGYQIKHRHSSVVVPTDPSDQLATDQLTKLLLYVFQFGNGYEQISQCFRGAGITGWNLLTLWKDYRTDPKNGEICFGREPYNGFLCDPYFTKMDMSDASNIIRRKYLSLPQTKSLLPDDKKELDTLFNYGWERDDKFTWLPYQQNPNGQKMMAYDEYWEQGFETKKYLYNVMTGDTIEYINEDSDFFLFADPNIELIEMTEQFVLQHILVNSQYIRTEKNPYNLNEYPFVPFFGLFEPESSDYTLKVQSWIRTMIDPQRMANQSRSQMIDIVQSSLNTGYIAEEGSVVNESSLYKSGQGKTIFRKKGTSNDAIVQRQPVQIPPSFFDLKNVHDSDISAVSNITDELLGQADSEQDSGLKVMLRQGAALVGLQDVFEGVRFAQETCTKKILKMIQGWSPEKLSRILGEEADPKIKNPSTLRFDVAVQEGVLTDTQQQLFFRQMIDLQQLGEPVPPGFLAKIAPLQGKTEYMKALDEFNQSQQQAQQQAAQTQEQQLNSQTELYQSQSIANIASAKERFTRAVANMGLEDERASKSVDNRADAVLKRAQAARQLDAMDDDRLMKFLDIFNGIEELSRRKEEQLKSDDIRISAQAANVPQQNGVNNG